MESPSKALMESPKTGKLAALDRGTPSSRSSRIRDQPVRWRENSEAREKNRASSSVEIMSYYLEHCHKPKPRHLPGFKKPKDHNDLPVAEPSRKDIFPKYPLPLNFLAMQQHYILQHPPVKQPLKSLTDATGMPLSPGASAAAPTSGELSD
uniref:Uncharacterized protein n=1 Tax=Eutreptiella gymnastica TaxID=73025 RepID=A0A7S4LGV1_9EUGL|mmetsp:Transcript_31040/g.52416  ORF Transcript_31040/g.52416 Transcript_31040/m.52416 type:complete len:151 (+) Transcript_31040:41-493(+)